MAKLNEKYLKATSNTVKQTMIENSIHSIEETKTVNGQTEKYHKYVFSDGSAIVECGAILDTEENFLSIQSHYFTDEEETSYENELIADTSKYDGEWLSYKSPNRY